MKLLWTGGGDTMNNGNNYAAIVIGVSAGGLSALETIFKELDAEFSLPILIVQHLSPSSANYLPVHFGARYPQKFKEADDKEMIEDSTIYFAPPNYHLLVEYDHHLALSAGARVNFSRPAIDVLFESAADVFADKLVGLILTGANSDGAVGLEKIKRYGGLTIVQDPKTAEVDAMPTAAFNATDVDHVLPLEQIGNFLNSLNRVN